MSKIHGTVRKDHFTSFVSFPTINILRSYFISKSIKAEDFYLLSKKEMMK